MNATPPPPSTGLRVLFALEALYWLALLALDLATIRAQLAVADLVPMRGMPIWIGLSALVCLVVFASSAISVRRGRGLLSGALTGPMAWLVLAFGVLVRIVLGVATMAWVTTMNGMQSV